MTLDELREKYLKFFEERGHAIVPSVPLVPDNDPTTLFTGSGMQPMMPYLLGENHPKGNRVVDSQKCFRSQDIEEVGDNRHTTFFEMLGNWSFGDYFKQEQLEWIWEFLTKEVGLDQDRLYVSVFEGDEKLGIPKDEEAINIWIDLGVKRDHIFLYPASENWWSRAGVPDNMPIGEPGGPDSEIFYDFGTKHKLHENSPFADQKCQPSCDCGRFFEIGNSVFMTYQKQKDGSFTELKQKNIDFGGGLERILACMNDNPDVFLTSAYRPIVEKLEELSGEKYEDHSVSFRVIADHLKAAVFLAADGILPGNKEQDYYSRRLVRRAVRHGKKIGIDKPFTGQLVKIVAQMYSNSYPEVGSQQTKIEQAFDQEESKFRKTLEKGIEELLDMTIPFEDGEHLPGVIAFRLFTSFGFPYELTEEIVADRWDMTINRKQFDDLMSKHRETSRTSSAGKFKGGLADQSENVIKYHTATHLLHASLRKVLGDHAEQKGSNITGERLRFDFSHPQALTDDQKQQVVQQINDWIEADLPVTKQNILYKQALDQGAIAFFGEKYPDEVSVFTIGKDPKNDWISKELCGGPHVNSTKDIGPIKITREKSASAGVRRIYIELKTS